MQQYSQQCILELSTPFTVCRGGRPVIGPMDITPIRSQVQHWLNRESLEDIMGQYKSL